MTIEKMGFGENKRLVETDYDYSLIVLGEPQALKRHRTFKRGTFVGNYDPSKADKKDFVVAIQHNAPEIPIDKPLMLAVNFYFGRPNSHYRTGRYAGELKPSAPLRHVKRPDIDNLLKFVADSLNDIFWRDDTLICRVEAQKVYSEKPRTEIYIKILDTLSEFG